MPAFRLIPFFFLALLLLVHAELWFGKGGLPTVVSLRSELAEQRARNEVARARNDRLLAEVNDLKDGVEIVEEKARRELSMIRPNELLVVVAPGSR